jgi:MFS family permease
MYSFIAGLAICSITIFAPFVTMFNRKCGTRACLVMGVAIQCAGLLGASFAKEIWTLFLCQGLLFGAGSCCLYVGSYGIIPQWFDKKRSLAVSLGSSGGGIGGLIWSLAAARMIDSPRLGFAWSFRITAIVAVVVNLICALVIKDRNHLIKTRQRAFDYRLLRRYELRLLLLWGIFSMLVYTIVLFSMADYAKHVQMSNAQAAIVTALVNLGMGVGRPIIGLASDKFGRFNVACTASVLGGLFCLCLWTAAGKDAHYWLYLFAFLGGITITGTFWAVSPFTLSSCGKMLITSRVRRSDPSPLKLLALKYCLMPFPSFGSPWPSRA